MEMIKVFFILSISTHLIGNVEARRLASLGTFDVRSYGVRADGRNDDSQVIQFSQFTRNIISSSAILNVFVVDPCSCLVQAFMAAWTAACSSIGSSVKVVIPAGTYLVGPTRFYGPCKTVQSIRVEMRASVSCEIFARQIST